MVMNVVMMSALLHIVRILRIRVAMDITSTMVMMVVVRMVLMILGLVMVWMLMMTTTIMLFLMMTIVVVSLRVTVHSDDEGAASLMMEVLSLTMTRGLMVVALVRVMKAMQMMEHAGDDCGKGDEEYPTDGWGNDRDDVGGYDGDIDDDEDDVDGDGGDGGGCGGYEAAVVDEVDDGDGADVDGDDAEIECDADD